MRESIDQRFELRRSCWRSRKEREGLFTCRASRSPEVLKPLGSTLWQLPSGALKIMDPAHDTLTSEVFIGTALKSERKAAAGITRSPKN